MPPRAPHQAEEAVKAQGFPSTSFFRPGMLDRGALIEGRGALEKIFMRLVPSHKVRTTTHHGHSHGASWE